jgi:hypothetical protein
MPVQGDSQLDFEVCNGKLWFGDDFVWLRDIGGISTVRLPLDRKVALGWRVTGCLSIVIMVAALLVIAVKDFISKDVFNTSRLGLLTWASAAASLCLVIFCAVQVIVTSRKNIRYGLLVKAGGEGRVVTDSVGRQPVLDLAEHIRCVIRALPGEQGPAVYHPEQRRPRERYSRRPGPGAGESGRSRVPWRRERGRRVG